MEDLRRGKPATQGSGWIPFSLLLMLSALVPSGLIATVPPEGSTQAEKSSLRAANGTSKQDTNQRAASKIGEIQKPLRDRNQYKYVELPNRLRAVVISVPNCDRAAACLALHAGAHQDPDDVPGTAHLVEHMLFMGSKKYPQPGNFFQFIWTNGGISNSHTDQMKTDFFFEIPPHLLPEALDRLVQNFAFPLLEESSVNDEIHAVDAEFNYRKTLDSRRLHMILSHVPRLPHLAKFTTGNLHSLLHGPRSKGIEPYEAMRKYHDTWYSANLMTLAVAGKESVEDLEEMVVRLFSDIPNFDKPAPVVPRCSVDYLPFPPRALYTVTYVVPVADLHQAIFAFYIPPTATLLDTKPELFISAILRHESSTCLGAKLKNEGLISSLFVKIKDSESCSRIELVLNLTEKGSEDIGRVGELVFLYLRYMAVEPIYKWRWKELHDLAEIAFNYQEQPEPADLVQNIASNLIYYPPAEVLRGESYMYVFDNQVISSILETMRPSNARILMVDKKYEPRCTKVLSGYPVQYEEEPVSAATRQLWNKIDRMSGAEVRVNMQKEKMALPKPNTFIPADLSLLKTLPDAPRYPELLQFTSEDVCSGMSCKVFFKQDTTFKAPRTFATLVVYHRRVAERIHDALMLKIFVACLEILLRQEMADAKLAGYSFKVKAGVEKTSPILRNIVRPNALVLHANGYSDKLPQVFQKGVALVAASVKAGLWKQVFPVASESLRKRLRADAFARAPVRQASDALANLLVSPSLDDAECVKYAEEATITLHEVEHWLRQYTVTTIAVEGLIQGDMDRNEAKEMVNAVLKQLQMPAPRPYPEVCQYSVFDMHNVVPALQTIRAWQGSPLDREASPIRLRYTMDNILTTDEQNGVTLYVQMGWPSLQRRALILLATLWLREKFFTELRTKQQLGYIVVFHTQTLENSRYLLFTVTSKYDVELVARRIEDFLDHHLNTAISQEDFEQIQKAAVDLNQVKHKSLSAEADFNFDQVVLREYMFDIKEQLCDVLKILTVDDFNTFLSEEVAKSPQILIAVRARDADKRSHPRLEDTLELKRAGQWIRIPKTAFAAR